MAVQGKGYQYYPKTLLFNPLGSLCSLARDSSEPWSKNDSSAFFSLCSHRSISAKTQSWLPGCFGKAMRQIRPLPWRATQADRSPSRASSSGRTGNPTKARSS